MADTLQELRDMRFTLQNIGATAFIKGGFWVTHQAESTITELDGLIKSVRNHPAYFLLDKEDTDAVTS
jgi:uncharacterized lipoprotein YajG